MKLLDRLIDKNNSITLPEGKSDINDITQNADLSRLFCNDELILKSLASIIRNKSNIIFVCDKSCDKLIISDYLKVLAGNSFNVKIIKTLENRTPFFNSGVKIIPDPDIDEVVKVLDYILRGYKSFMMGLSLSSCDNFLEKIKTIIAVNFTNLTSNNVDVLLGCSDLYAVLINKNADGIYNVLQIKKLDYVNEKLAVSDLINSEEKDFQESVSENNADIVNTEVDVQNSEIQDNLVSEQETPKKINKYKLLKEKYKKKHTSNEIE